MSHLLNMKIRSSRGFTAIEMIIVLVIISVLSAMAVPSFLQWRQSLEARETAMDFVNILRKAKSDAINTNRQQQVQFDATLKHYGQRQGSQTNTNWATASAVASWTNLKSEVFFTPSVNVEFNPNGTSTVNSIVTSATITVQNNAATRTFTVSVASTGRISMQ
ncbi:MAG: GspH/FimT family pseudopilin [Nitrospirota bacterium]